MRIQRAFSGGTLHGHMPFGSFQTQVQAQMQKTDINEPWALCRCVLGGTPHMSSEGVPKASQTLMLGAACLMSFSFFLDRSFSNPPPSRLLPLGLVSFQAHAPWGLADLDSRGQRVDVKNKAF